MDQKIIPDSSERVLNEQDLKGKDEASIGLARNEIYARHGKEFQNQTYAEHFKNQEWYKPNQNFKESDLTPVEQRNIHFLHVVELDYGLNGQRDKYQKEANIPKDLPGSFIADSSARALDAKELSKMSPEQLRTATNEIYARHGYPFQKPEVKNYYEKQPWYKPNSSFDSYKDLSWLEERNIEFMQLETLDRKLGKK